MNIGNNFFLVRVYNSPGHPGHGVPKLITCTVSSITPKRVYFTANTEDPAYGKLGNLDRGQRHYYDANSSELQFTTPSSAIASATASTADTIARLQIELQVASRQADLLAILAQGMLGPVQSEPVQASTQVEPVVVEAGETRSTTEDEVEASFDDSVDEVGLPTET